MQSVSCMRFLINSCINDEKHANYVQCLHKMLFNLEINKCGQILNDH